MKKICSIFFALIIMIYTSLSFSENIMKEAKCKSSGGSSYSKLSDGRYRNSFETRPQKESYIELNFNKEVYALSIKWDKLPGEWELQSFDENTWKTIAIYGTKGFLIEYVEVPALKKLRIYKKSEKLDYFKIYEIEAYDSKDIPDDVQIWKENNSKSDIMIIMAHPDDEFIFLGGLIPKYSKKSGKRLQVCHLTYGSEMRRYELLHALWHSNLDIYPDIGCFRDKYSKSLDRAYQIWKNDDVLKHVVNLYRKYKPEVVVTHDINGEYGHGAHRAAADLAIKAFDLAADKNYVTEYEPWQAKKLYVHLGSDESKIIKIDWKKPLDYLGGRSPFDLANESWEFHKSQHGGRVDYQGRTFFFDVVDGGVFDNSKYSLVKSMVGEDEKKNDFFEHIDD